MFLRMMELRANQEHLNFLKPFYDQIVLPDLQENADCFFAALMQNQVAPENFVSLSIWKHKEEAELYGQSEAYQKMRKQLLPILAESSEWKVQLTDSLDLQYGPVKQEPVEKELEVRLRSGIFQPENEDFSRLYIRIVKVKTKQAGPEEFHKLYDSEIIPVLRKTPGCLFASLTENTDDEDEHFSFTIWENEQSATRYEENGQFGRLVDKVKHTLSEMTQWKMALESTGKAQIKTNQDLDVTRYKLVSSKNFT